jgi:transmembrane sensor
MNEEEIKELLKRYREGNCTEQEKESVELWFHLTSEQSDWQWRNPAHKEKLRDNILSGIREITRQPEPEKFRIWSYISVAASVLILLFAGGYYYFSNQKNPLQKPFHQIAVAPGSKQAMLTLSDGSSVLVNDAARGVVASDGFSLVLKNNEGALEYQSANDHQKHAGRNTLAVPRGGTFQITMPDGTKAWINSASTITYPAGNTDSERLVELTGEAYFEVTKDKKRPFRVISNGTEILVTGTHFNVSAYEDDQQVTTTLAEGAVVVSNHGQQKTLTPGQQSMSSASGDITLGKVDLESALAWKEGYFVFEDQDLKSVMKMVSRWYDVEIEYQGTIPDSKFGGTFSKSKSLDGLLNYLKQLSNIQFKQQGNKITIMK